MRIDRSSGRVMRVNADDPEDDDKDGPTTGGDRLEGRSANHFELAFTRFEVLVDFGQAYQNAPVMHTRIIMTPHAAKTLSTMLAELLDQYERAVGPIQERLQ
jgi:hypothetical protein